MRTCSSKSKAAELIRRRERFFGGEGGGVGRCKEKVCPFSKWKVMCWHLHCQVNAEIMSFAGSFIRCVKATLFIRICEGNNTSTPFPLKWGEWGTSDWNSKKEFWGRCVGVQCGARTRNENEIKGGRQTDTAWAKSGKSCHRWWDSERIDHRLNQG